MKIRLGTLDANDILLHLQEKGAVRGIRKLIGSPSGCEVTVEAVKPTQTDPQRGLYWASLDDWVESEWAKEAGVTRGLSARSLFSENIWLRSDRDIWSAIV